MNDKVGNKLSKENYSSNAVKWSKMHNMLNRFYNFLWFLRFTLTVCLTWSATTRATRCGQASSRSRWASRRRLPTRTRANPGSTPSFPAARLTMFSPKYQEPTLCIMYPDIFVRVFKDKIYRGSRLWNFNRFYFWSIELFYHLLKLHTHVVKFVLVTAR